MRKIFLSLLTTLIASNAFTLQAKDLEPTTGSSIKNAPQNTALANHYLSMLKLHQRYEIVKAGFASLNSLSENLGISYLTPKQQSDMKQFEAEKIKLEEKLKLNLAEYWRYPSSDLVALNNQISSDIERLNKNPEYSTANSIGFDFPLFNGENFSTTMSKAELRLALNSINGAAANLGAALATVTTKEKLQEKLGFHPARIKPQSDHAYVDLPKEN